MRMWRRSGKYGCGKKKSAIVKKAAKKGDDAGRHAPMADRAYIEKRGQI